MACLLFTIEAGAADVFAVGLLPERTSRDWLEITEYPMFVSTLHRPLMYSKKWVNGPSYKRWKLNVPILANCYRLAGQLMSDLLDK